MSQSRHPQRTIEIDGPVLLLMGYIGTFFARMARHLEAEGVEVYKVSFPLHEFGFPAHQRLPYSGPMGDFRAFLKTQIQERGIRHVFMVNDYPIPHRIALIYVRSWPAGPCNDSYVLSWVTCAPITSPWSGRRHPAVPSTSPQSFISVCLRSSVILRRAARVVCAGASLEGSNLAARFSPVTGLWRSPQVAAHPWLCVGSCEGVCSQVSLAISERRVKAALFDGSPFFSVCCRGD